jgi:hypothetical protein
MSAYGTGTSISELLTAMRDKAMQDTATLGYLRDVGVALPPMTGAVLNTPKLYIVWSGSPEETISAENGVRVKRATHQVTLYAVVYAASHDDTASILGDGYQVGITKLAEDVIDFYAGNTLGLTGLDAANTPDIQAVEGSYGVFPTLDDKWMHIIGLVYSARTKPFERA